MKSFVNEERRSPKHETSKRGENVSECGCHARFRFYSRNLKIVTEPPFCVWARRLLDLIRNFTKNKTAAAS